MYIFKTSGATLPGVIKHQKHAFVSEPREWDVGELVLISKNVVDCRYGEKQIQYIMEIDNIRKLLPGECEKYWPGNEGRWEYLVECSNVKQIARPFNLQDIIGNDKYQKDYHGVVCYKRLPFEDELQVNNYLKLSGLRL
jgi:hypothetical protein